LPAGLPKKQAERYFDQPLPALPRAAFYYAFPIKPMTGGNWFTQHRHSGETHD
jgi:hypothetical protein